MNELNNMAQALRDRQETSERLARALDSMLALAAEYMTHHASVHERWRWGVDVQEAKESLQHFKDVHGY